MFARAPLLKRLLYYRNVPTRFTARLREVLRDAQGNELTLGSDALRTLVLLVMRNETTNSPWPLSNNPYAKYNDRALRDCNLRLPLWQLIRASTAAPTFFPPEQIRLDEDVTFTFVDGAVTVYNNPAFLLFLMATLPEYKVGWPMGEDRLLLVSIGTGALTGAAKNVKPAQMTVLYSARAVPAALIDAALNEQDVLCRVFGRCRFGDPVDRPLHVGAPVVLARDARVPHDAKACLMTAKNGDRENWGHHAPLKNSVSIESRRRVVSPFSRCC